MHEKAQTLQALPDIIKFYKEQGYEFGVYNDEDHFSSKLPERSTSIVNVVILTRCFLLLNQ